MIEIPLNKGKVALVDDCDAHLALIPWKARLKRGRTYYAQTNEHPSRRLHREVLGVTDPSIEIDHVNGDGLDNRRCNLRIATNAQNGANRGPQKNNKCGFKGVSFGRTDRKWRAQIKVSGRKIYLGLFVTPEEAAHAYDSAARRYFGDFAWLNFPGGNERAA